MSEKSAEKSISALRKFNLIYSICLSILIVITGVCFIVAVCHLYFTGTDEPYTRERVGEYLRAIIVPIVLTIAASICAGFFSIAFSASERMREKKINYSLQRRTLARVFVMGRNSTACEEVQKERNKRRIIRIITSASATFLLALSFLLAILIPEHTVEGFNSHVFSAILIITPATVISIVGIFVSLLICSFSEMREYLIMKDEIKSCPEARDKSINTYSTLEKPRTLLLIRSAVIAVAVIFIVLGVINSGAYDVYAKAVAICTECIGLG